MSKLIYVDRLKKDILALQDCYNGFSDTYDKDCIIGVIDEQPTIEERKVGKWLDAEWENINTGEKRKGRRCSVCKCGYFRYDVSVNTVSDIPNFCPNCGAKMEGNT